MLDIVLLMLLFLLGITAFLILHYFILRGFLKTSLLHCSIAAAFLAVGAVTVFSYYILSGLFSSIETYAVAAAGSGLAVLFASGLYTFLGPATADRSLACQMLVYLYEKPGGRIGREELLGKFDPGDFVEKRIEECRMEGILVDEGGSVVLTDKGRSVAKPYVYLIRLLRLRERAGYVQYFRPGGGGNIE